MNDKRIREIARESGIKLMNDESLALGYLTANQKKIAELIIKECCSISENYATDSLPLSISLAIQKHFGLK